jgi:plasmid stabilization system protein ParE
MKRFSVVFSEDALAEFVASIKWGSEVWGEEIAWKWYAETRGLIRKLLSTIPKSQPVAPDNDEYDIEVRQMIVSRRYRVLFTVERQTVTILHLRGPYTGK